MTPHIQKIKMILDTRAIPVPESGCWLWDRGQENNWYGEFRLDGKHYTAHRAAYLAYKGAIPDGIHVLHSCDTKLCCNPDHLRLGANSENINDSCIRDRRSAVASNSAVEEMRLLRSQGVSCSDIAKKFNISLPYVSAITTGRSRRYVGGVISKPQSWPKLDEESIRSEYKKGGISIQKLAENYGTTYGRVYRIVH